MRIILLFLILNFVFVSAFAQTDHTFGRKKISLTQHLKAKNVVVLTQKSATYYFDFDRYKAYFLAKRDMPEYLLDAIELTNSMALQIENDTLYLNPFLKTSPVSGVTHSFLYREIKSKNVLIFNNKTQTWARKLIRKKFTEDCGHPRCGSGGFRFYFPKDTDAIFEWITWIS